MSLVILTPYAALSDGDNSCFSQGSIRISGGLSFSYLGVYTAIDLGIHDLISIGGAAGYNRHLYLSGWKYYRYPALGKIALHPLNFGFLSDLILIRDRLDVYGGVAAGYVLITSSWHGVTDPIGTPDESGIRIGEYLGVRLFLNDRWHIFVEDCGEVTNFALGVGMKL